VINSIYYPTSINIEKINGKLQDKVKVFNAQVINELPMTLEMPKGYQISDDILIQSKVSVKKYRPNLHFVELEHTRDRVLIVEFDNFLLVAEAPLNSENGETILQQAHKIAPNKPIKYFVFGHYHPHYLGGIRPFVNSGAKIISTAMDKQYVEYLTNAPHTIKPDKLQLSKKQVEFEIVNKKLTIEDKDFSMEIYHIGNKSQHSDDYLIYYFPTEKLLFEDDLVMIGKDNKVRKAGTSNYVLNQVFF
jgi:glyoxylase-like metal-dependent hydrolase (beta-lactamase superfamily II)